MIEIIWWIGGFQLECKIDYRCDFKLEGNLLYKQ